MYVSVPVCVYMKKMLPVLDQRSRGVQDKINQVQRPNSTGQLFLRLYC